MAPARVSTYDGREKTRNGEPHPSLKSLPRPSSPSNLRPPQVLPVVSYLLSDVIVFVDVVEPRRLHMFFERVQEFASTAWAGCRASGWQPALILVQNKWHYSEKDSDIDITKAFIQNVDKENTLSKIFADVHFLRVPHSQYAGALEAGVDLLKLTIEEAIKAVHLKRKEQGTLYTEREWWTLAPQVTEGRSSCKCETSARGASSEHFLALTRTLPLTLTPGDRGVLSHARAHQPSSHPAP